jgi:hypothetical protein
VEIDYTLILSYGIQMTITFAVGILLYSIRILRSKENTSLWYMEHFLQLSESLIVFWVISAGLVMVPNFAKILGALGFNADQSAAGIALVVLGFLITGAEKDLKDKQLKKEE